MLSCHGIVSSPSSTSACQPDSQGNVVVASTMHEILVQPALLDSQRTNSSKKTPAQHRGMPTFHHLIIYQPLHPLQLMIQTLYSKPKPRTTSPENTHHADQNKCNVVHLSPISSPHPIFQQLTMRRPMRSLIKLINLLRPIQPLSRPIHILRSPTPPQRARLQIPQDRPITRITPMRTGRSMASTTLNICILDEPSWMPTSC
jgi:hypothetical protein